MWKKIFAASLLASVSSVLFLGSSDVSAAIVAPMPYEPGDWIGPYSGNVNVCASGSDSYSLSETPLVADIQYADVSTQIVFNSNSSCRRFEGVSSLRVRYFAPIGVHSDLLQEGSSLDGESYVSVRVFRDGTASNYFWAAGLAEQSFEGVSTAISFNANGGEGTMAEITDLLVGASVILPQNTLLRSGYRFMGWNTEEDGSGDDYADGATVTIRPEMAGGFTLYAVWAVDEAVLDTGRTVNVKLKQQAGATAPRYFDIDTKIKAVRRADALPGGFDINDSANIISSDDSANKIYSWFDDSDGNNDGEGDGIIYYYSEASKVKGGDWMFNMFESMWELADISGVANFDVSGTRYMQGLFSEDKKLVDIGPLSGWDTSNCVTLNAVFYGTLSLKDITPIATWNTSRVKDFSELFNSSSIISVDALETKQRPGKDYVSWDTSNVESLSGTFSQTSSLVDISALASWDTSKVKSLSDTFHSASALVDISALANWDTSSVQDMQSVFAYAQSIVDYSPLSSWNTSSVTTMAHLFLSGGLTNLNAFETKQHPGKDYISWDVSNVKDMTKVFSGNDYLEDISALASWNTASLENMSYLVAGSLITNVDALETKQYPGRDYVSWNVSNVKDMSAVFNECSRLSDISKLSTWDVSSATDMTRLFYRNYSLSSLAPIFGWMSDSSAVTMTEMFDGVPAAVARPDWYHE